MMGVHISENSRGRTNYCVLHWDIHTPWADVGVDACPMSNSNTDNEFPRFFLHPLEEQDPDNLIRRLQIRHPGRECFGLSVSD